MRKAALFSVVLLFISLILGCGPQASPGDTSLTKSPKITVYQNGQAKEVHPDSSVYQEMVNTTEETLDSIEDVYKEAGSPSGIKNSDLSIFVEYQETRTKKLFNSEQQFTHVVIPLVEQSMERGTLAVGNLDAASFYKTDLENLKHLRQLAQEFLKNSK